MFEVQEFVDVFLEKSDKRFQGAILHGDDAHIVVGCKSCDSEYLTSGMVVKLIQAVNGALYEFNSQILQCRPNAFALNRVQPTIVERRCYKRFNCKLAAWYICDSADDNILHHHVRTRSTAIDISEGGMRLILKEDISVNTCFEVEIDVGESRMLSARAIVLRCSQRESLILDESSSIRYTVSAEFLNLSRISRNALVHLVKKLVPV